MRTKQRLPDGRRRGRWAWAQHLRGGQECAGPLEQVTISGTEQTVVAHFDEALGQHVLEEAANECWGGQGASSELLSSRFLVLKSDLAVGELEEALVAEGDAKDVRGEILERRCAGADRLRVDDPLLLPCLLSHLSEQLGLFELVSELGAEDDGESKDGDQKVFAGRLPASVRGETAAGDDVVNVGMVAGASSVWPS